MRKIIYLLVLSPFLLLAQYSDITYTIIEAKDSIYLLGHHFGDQRIVYDTIKNENKGVFKINYEDGLRPGLYFIYGPESQFYQEFIVNEHSFLVTSDGTYQGTSIKNSEENKLFVRFQTEALTIQNEVLDLTEALKTSSSEDSVSIIGKIRGLEIELKSRRQKLLSENPNLLVSKMLGLIDPIKLEENDYEGLNDTEKQKKRYYDFRNKFRNRLDFTEEGLIRTPIFKRNVMQFVTEVIPQVPDSIINELDKILETIESDSASFRYWLSTFTNHFESSKLMGMQAVLVHLLDKYYLSEKVTWISEEARIKMEQEIKLMKPNQIGKIAPPLLLIDTAERPLPPLKLSPKYLVLYFYDPDCGICKKKTPILKENYPAIKELGAEVIAVNIANEVEKWKNYIKKNELDWINLGDPYFRSPFREKYNIRSTPFLYVLDQDRRIIARKLGVDQVVDFIANYKKALEDFN